MKEMVYDCNLQKAEILEKGEYKGYKFVILNVGTHPTAYVENKVNALDYYDERLNNIKVHGGFTYCGEPHWDRDDHTEYLGWDYAHLGDYFDGIFGLNSKKYSTEEIYEEVKYVIDQLHKIEEQNKVLNVGDRVVVASTKNDSLTGAHGAIEDICSFKCFDGPTYLIKLDEPVEGVTCELINYIYVKGSSLQKEEQE